MTRTKLNVLEQSGEKIAIYGANLQSPATNGEKIATSLFECECGKKYSARNSLWYHKKTCYIYQDGKLKNNNDIQQEYSDDDDSNYSQILPTYTKEKEVEFKELILLLLKENKEIQKNFVDLIPHIQGNNTNCNNTITNNTTNNNQFNINMFLNEHCKNAMNLTDFIHSLPITNETYDNTIENGLTKTITSLITNGLNNMDVLDKFFKKFSYKFPKGYPDINDVQDMLMLEGMLKEMGIDLNELTVSPTYQTRGVSNPFYNLTPETDNQIRDILNKKTNRK